MSANGGLGFFGLGAARFRLALRVHLLERQFMLFLIKLFGHSSVYEGEVYRINVRIENDVIEVPDDNRERREDRFIKVDGQRNVDPPARQEAKEADLEPDHQTSEAHDEGAPDDGPVFRLLGITKPRDFWLRLLQTKVITEIADDDAHVLQYGQHVSYPTPAVL